MREIATLGLLALFAAAVFGEEVNKDEGFAFSCQTGGKKGRCAQVRSDIATAEIVSLLDFGVVTKFMPEDAAKDVLDEIKGLDATEWTRTMTEAPENVHAFDRNKRRKAGAQMDFKTVDLQNEFFSDLREKMSPHFTRLMRVYPGDEIQLFLGKYQAGGYMTSHDDVKSATIGGAPYYRVRGFALFLNRQWEEEDGGLLIDEDDGDKPYAPSFNTLVHWKVPRWHSVTPVKGKKTLAVVYGFVLRKQPTLFEAAQMFVRETAKKPTAYMPLLFCCIVALRLYLFPLRFGSNQDTGEGGGAKGEGEGGGKAGAAAADKKAK